MSPRKETVPRSRGARRAEPVRRPPLPGSSASTGRASAMWPEAAPAPAGARPHSGKAQRKREGVETLLWLRRSVSVLGQFLGDGEAHREGSWEDAGRGGDREARRATGTVSPGRPRTFSPARSCRPPLCSHTPSHKVIEEKSAQFSC